MKDPASRQERALRQVLRLVDLSRDLDRNRDDSNFADEGGEIIYVLDENIFEIFIRPFRHSESVETFYSEIWSASRERSHSWRSYESQAALIASEFLLSSMLPGSRTSTVRLTESHRWELAQRVEDLAQEFRQLLQRDASKIKDELSAKFNALTNLVTSNYGASIWNRSQDDQTLAEDLHKLRAAGTSDAALGRFFAARAAVKVLASDGTTEPLDQLRRVVTPPIGSKLKTLSIEFSPSPDEAKSIEAEASNWFQRIVSELQRPGHRERQRAQGVVGRAVWNDARSIAFVLWLSRYRLKPNQRVAFVTGDMALFDAYRRWHSLEGRESLTSIEPFVMRRATQYSPIFNPHDSGGDLSIASPLVRTNLFSLIQQAVEASLLPLTLSLSRDPQRQEANRERLALKAIDLENLSDDSELAVFAEKISEDWLANHESRIAAIRELWQEAQRVAVGASFDLIVARLSNEQREIVDQMTGGDSEKTDRLLSDYAANLLDKLVDNSIELWLPLAEEFIRTQAAFVTKRLTFIISLDEATAKDGIVGSESSRLPQLVFANAAIHALYVQDTSNAVRFSGLAMRSGEFRSQGDGPHALDLELQYLAGVSYTGEIGSFKEHLSLKSLPRLRARSLQRVKESYAKASSLLHNCLSNHFTVATEGGRCRSQYDDIRYIRALSARAALNLYAAASIGLYARGREPNDRREVANYLRIAKGDLFICAKLDRGIEDTELLKRVRQQYLTNAAAAEVLTFLFSEQGKYNFDKRLNQLVKSIERLAESMENPHALLRAELTTFFYLADRKAPVSFSIDGFRKAGLWQEAKLLRLPLDRALFSAIHNQMIVERVRV